ncbi:MAG TPA: MFS transporter, partial [Micromonospora sp.]
GMLQTAQRIGSAAGIAGVGAVFFSSLAGNGGDWPAALRSALLVILGFVLAALLTALADRRPGASRARG